MSVKQILIVVFFMMFIVNFIPRANASIVHDNEEWTLQGTLGKSISQVEAEQAGSSWVLPSIDEVSRFLFERGLEHGHSIFIHDVDSKARLTSEGLGSIYQGFRGLARNYKGGTVYLVEVAINGTIYTEKTYRWNNWLFSANDQGAEPLSTVFLKRQHVPTTSPVPVPGAVWLFGSAIMGLIVRRKLWNKK